MMICLRCLQENNSNEDRCKVCGSQNVVQIKDNRYRYRGQAYTKKGFEKEIFKLFLITKEEIKINNPNGDYHNQYLKNFFLNSTAKYTFLMLILPWLLFLFLSLLISGTGLLFYNSEKYGFNKGYQNVYIFAAYVSLIFLIFSIILFIKGFILKEKVILKPYHRKTRTVHISYQKYQEIIKLLDSESG